MKICFDFRNFSDNFELSQILSTNTANLRIVPRFAENIREFRHKFINLNIRMTNLLKTFQLKSHELKLSSV